jgi:hypothetical protein
MKPLNMKRNTLILAFCLLSVRPCFAQCMTAKEANQLEGVIHNFFDSPDWEKRIAHNKPGARSEAFICLLSIDSNGKVTAVNLLADEKNRDSAFAIFSKLEPKHFKDWQAKSCKNKTVIVPIALLTSSEKPKYVKDLMSALRSAEGKNYIITRECAFGWPVSVQ